VNSLINEPIEEYVPPAFQEIRDIHHNIEMIIHCLLCSDCNGTGVKRRRLTHDSYDEWECSCRQALRDSVEKKS
jgi:hypothetical protein